MIIIGLILLLIIAIEVAPNVTDKVAIVVDGIIRVAFWLFVTVFWIAHCRLDLRAA